MRRCFAAWLLLARERWWKSQLASMESQVGLMESKIRGYEKRPIPVRPRAGNGRQGMTADGSVSGPEH